MRDDCPNFTGCSRYPVACRAVTCRKAFSWYDKSCRIGPKIEEKLGEDVEGKQGLGAEFVVSKSDDNEYDGEEKEAHDLYRLAAEGVYGGY